MHPRRRIGVTTVILIGLALGLFMKNVKVGLIIGLGLGLLAGGLLNSKR